MLDHLLPTTDAGWLAAGLVAAFWLPRLGFFRLPPAPWDLYVLERLYYELQDSPHAKQTPSGRHFDAFEDFGAAKAAWEKWEHPDAFKHRASRGEEGEHVLYLVVAATKAAAIQAAEKGTPGLSNGGYVLMFTPFQKRLDLRYSHARRVKERQQAEAEAAAS